MVSLKSFKISKFKGCLKASSPLLFSEREGSYGNFVETSSKWFS